MTSAAINTSPLAPPGRAAQHEAADWSGRWRRPAGRFALALAALLLAFLVYEVTVASVREQLAQRTLRTEFVDSVKSGSAGALDQPVADGPVAELRIPQLGLDQIVVQGSSPAHLQDGPGHYPSSVLPGEFGNAVILGHHWLAGGSFRGLASLHDKDEIEVVTGQGRFTYVVEQVQRLGKGDKDVIGPSLDSRLTLATSASMFSSDRIAVTAKLEGKPLGVPTRAAQASSESAGGRVGDDARLFAALLWLEALVLVLFGTRLAYRHWPRPAAHLVTTPLVVAIALVLFMNLDRALPGTT